MFTASDGVTAWRLNPTPPPPDLVGKGFLEQGFAATEFKLIW